MCDALSDDFYDYFVANHQPTITYPVFLWFISLSRIVLEIVKNR